MTIDCPVYCQKIYPDLLKLIYPVNYSQKAVDMLLDNEDKISVSAPGLPSALHEGSDECSLPADPVSPSCAHRQTGW